MADFTQEQIVDALGNLTVMEMLALTRTLEQQWGVSAQPVALLGIAGSPQSLAVHMDEQTEFSVTIVDAGPNKINVIKVVREITALGLKEAKDLVDGAPKLLKDQLGKQDALDLKAKLEAAGAKIDVK